MFTPPKDDHERFMNLVEALAEPGDEPDALDEIMNEELKQRGHTLESWAAELQAKGREVIERQERARRARRRKIGAGVAIAAFALAAGVALVFYVKGRDPGGNAAQPKLDQGCTCEAAGASSRDGERPWAPAAGLGLLLGLLLLRRAKIAE